MELYAIQYGENFKYATMGTVFRGAENPNELVDDFIFLYYLAKYKGKTILFDTGFRNQTQAEHMGITLHDVRSEVDKLVDDIYNADIIFITHSHFDHIDNLDLFTKPTVIISEAEYETAMEQSPDAVRQKLQSCEVIRVKDDFVYEDKFHFRVVGGHSIGSSVIYFDEGEKQYVITGDECYMCDNVIHNISNGMIHDATSNDTFIADAYNRGLIPLPYHDNNVFLGHERISEHIVRVI